jgi:glutaminyl-tRNA synthetase
VDVTLLEHAIREDLNATSPRLMGVLRPLRVVIENYPEDAEESFELALNPGDDAAGSRAVPFCREVFVDREDFMEVPAPKFWRIFPGNEVRLRGACLLTVTRVIKDDAGEVTELRATWDPESRGGNAPDGRKVKGTVHWVSARHAVPAEVRLYDRLFTEENPLGDEERDLVEFLNPDSLEVLSGCMLEPSVREFGPLSRLQLERVGYFCVDAASEDGGLVLNRTIALKDSWAKVVAKR